MYDEAETPAGKYDEIGTRAGIQAFGSIHWLRQVPPALAPLRGSSIGALSFSTPLAPLVLRRGPSSRWRPILHPAAAQTNEGRPSNYGRPDAQRHLMIKLFDVLFLNGEQVTPPASVSLAPTSPPSASTS